MSTKEETTDQKVIRLGHRKSRVSNTISKGL